MYSLLRLVCLVLLFPVASSVAQDTAVSNVNQPRAGFTLGVGKNSGFDFSVGFNFLTSASSANFASVSFVSAGAFGAASGFTLSLYSGFSASGPTGLITSLTGANPATDSGTYTYTPTVPVTLMGNTSYWLLASAPSTPANSSYGLYATSSDAEDVTGLAGWTIGNTRMFTSNGGSTWSSGTEVPLFSVQVSAIPEPSTYALGAGAIALVGAFLWRRDKRSFHS
jgi:hypothetical protein